MNPQSRAGKVVDTKSIDALIAPKTMAMMKNFEVAFKDQIVAGGVAEEEARKYLNQGKGIMKLPVEQVDAVIKKYVLEKKVKPVPVKVPEPEHIETKIPVIDNIKRIVDEVYSKNLDENKFFLELEKDIFRNEKDLDNLLEISQSLVKENSVEKEEDYLAFAEKGLIKGGSVEVKRDLADLAQRVEDFKKKNLLLDPKQAQNLEKNKKIATIVERAVSFCVSKLKWYGNSVSVEPVSQFDDVKRGVDQVLEIKKEDDSSFMGLGVDVTYRGILSEKFKDKFFNLLTSINSGHKSKIKYFKNNKGEMMKEFAVPKAVLYFNVSDLKDLVYLIKNSDKDEVREEFKNSNHKFNVLNQILIQCELLAQFAEESQNDIFRKYTDIVSSIKELGWKNPEVQVLLDSRHTDDVAHHLKYLISMFKNTKFDNGKR